MNTKVDFFIVGQPKSGTTALAQFLAQHPDVCFSLPKEPEYFATDLRQESDSYYGKPSYMPIRTPESYDRCFAHKQDRQLCGEATAIYLRSTTAAKEIFKHNPNVKIIILLRNPADFLHSMHMQYINSAMEDEEVFENALALEEQRKKGKHLPKKVRYPSALFYSEIGKYYSGLKRFYDIFPKENIRVFTNEEFRENNESVYLEVASLIGLDNSFTPNFQEVHKSKTPRFKTLTNVLHTPLLWNTAHRILPTKLYVQLSGIIHSLLLKEQPRSKLDDETRQKLYILFRSDIEKTSKLINRDLIKEWQIDT